MSHHIKWLSIFLLGIFPLLQLYGQQKIESEKINQIIKTASEVYYNNYEGEYNVDEILFLINTYEKGKILDPYVKIEASIVICDFDQRNYEPVRGLKMITEAVRLTEELQLWDKYLHSIAVQCNIMRLLGQKEEIEKILLKGLDIAETNNVGFAKLCILSELAIHYAYSLQQFENAIFFGHRFKEHLKVYNPSQVNDEGFIYSNSVDANIVNLEMANSYLGLNKPALAKPYLDKALTFFEINHDDEKLARAYMYKAKYAIMINKVDSLPYLYDQITLHNKAHWTSGIKQLEEAPEHLAKLMSLEKTLSTGQTHITLLSKTRMALASLLLLILIIVFLGYRYYQVANNTQILLNNALHKQIEYADMLNAEKTKYFAILSHELRTPIFAITGLTNLLKNARRPKKEYINGIINSGNHLLQLVNNVLQLNKLETADNVAIQNDTFDMVECLTEVIQTTLLFCPKKRRKNNQ